jgi:hypothetical protein
VGKTVLVVGDFPLRCARLVRLRDRAERNASSSSVNLAYTLGNRPG